MAEAASRVFIQDVMGASKPEALADLMGPALGDSSASSQTLLGVGQQQQPR